MEEVVRRSLTLAGLAPAAIALSLLTGCSSGSPILLSAR
jgi:hypothetical protein